jgi:hypothetical protein
VGALLVRIFFAELIFVFNVLEKLLNDKKFLVKTQQNFLFENSFMHTCLVALVFYSVFECKQVIFRRNLKCLRRNYFFKDF